MAMNIDRILLDMYAENGFTTISHRTLKTKTTMNNSLIVYINNGYSTFTACVLWIAFGFCWQTLTVCSYSRIMYSLKISACYVSVLPFWEILGITFGMTLTRVCVCVLTWHAKSGHCACFVYPKSGLPFKSRHTQCWLQFRTRYPWKPLNWPQNYRGSLSPLLALNYFIHEWKFAVGQNLIRSSSPFTC